MTSAELAGRSGAPPDEAASRAGVLFEHHGRMVYGLCRAMLRDVHEAEDAAQQVFLSAHRALLGGVEVRDPARWLATIARNECRGRIVSGMRAPLPVSEEDLELVPAIRDEQAAREQFLELRATLAALPERQRQAVVLRYLYGFRYGEVAAALGLSRAATEALLFRARRALRRRLAVLAGATIVVPASLREELALAIPGFSTGTGPSVAAVGAAGVLAKLAAAPGSVKVAATAAAAVSTVGAAGTTHSDRPARESGRGPAVIHAAGPERTAAPATRRVVIEPRLERGEESDRSGPGSGAETEESRSGHRQGAGRDSSTREPELADSSGPGSGSSASGNPELAERSGSSGPSESSGPSDSSGSGSSDLSTSSGGSSTSGSSGESGHGSGSGEGEP